MDEFGKTRMPSLPVISQGWRISGTDTELISFAQGSG
jgi:hypothetical protein